jgi:hypothetical protein
VWKKYGIPSRGREWGLPKVIAVKFLATVSSSFLRRIL